MYDEPTAPYAVPPMPIPVDRPHAGFGIASFILSISAGIMLFVSFVAAGVMEASTPGGIDEASPMAVILGLCILGLLGLLMIAFILGIAGLCQPHRRKLFAILGMIFSGLGLAVTVSLMILGTMVA